MDNVTPNRAVCATRDWLEDAKRLFAHRIELLLKARTTAAAAQPHFAGFIPTDDALCLVRDILNGPALRPPDTKEMAQINQRLSSPSLISGLPVGHLIDVFNLSSDVAPLLALLMASTRDARFGQLFAWLNDDAQRRYLTPAIADLLAGPIEGLCDIHLAATSPLINLRIVELGANGERGQMEQVLQLTKPVAGWLMQDRIFWPEEPELLGQLQDVAFAPMSVLWSTPDAPEITTDGPFAMNGVAGNGRAAIIAALWAQQNITAKQLDAAAIQTTPEHLLRLAMRDAALARAGLIVKNAERLPIALLRWVVKNHPAPIAFISAHRLAVDIPQFSAPPQQPERLKGIWRHALGAKRMVSADRLAHQFRLPVAEILEIGKSDLTKHADLTRACLDRSSGILDELATLITPRYDWDDLVLPKRNKLRLEAIVTRIRHAGMVFGDWGFGRKLVPNRGLSALFTGPSGAGKTLSASVIARALGLPLYRVDLSATVSKYIGETEKNLEKIFCAAEAGNACLVFDECDAIFGKRSDVSDAHDRYANIETSYLLQRMESHRGVIMMSSNYPQNIDDAFTRRIDVTVEFSMPDANLRSILWQRLLPVEAGAQIECELLGNQFELSGGSIRNCLVTAAFLAAEAHEPMVTQHCIQAVAMEYEKTGRPLTRAEFGSAFPALRTSGGG